MCVGLPKKLSTDFSCKVHQKPNKELHILDKRFGHLFIGTNAYRDKLRNWTKIDVKDHHGLRRLADLLTSVEIATEVIKNLNVLNGKPAAKHQITRLACFTVKQKPQEEGKKRSRFQDLHDLYQF